MVFGKLPCRLRSSDCCSREDKSGISESGPVPEEPGHSVGCNDEETVALLDAFALRGPARAVDTPAVAA